MAQRKFDTVTREDLSQGYTLYTGKCGSCHVLYKPEQFTEEKWRIEIPEMSDRAKLNATEESQLLIYILTQREVNLQRADSAK